MDCNSTNDTLIGNTSCIYALPCGYCSIMNRPCVKQKKELKITFDTVTGGDDNGRKT